jgi:nitrite reductase/ring-hydroxylating ferredoxin subunit
VTTPTQATPITCSGSLRDRYPFTPNPDGWYIISMSDELAPGQVRSLRYFGRDLVLYRTEGGKPMLVDAYCPHLGGHLGLGAVKGETLQCAFHNFRYDCAGVCIESPYAGKIPPTARLKPWAVQEVDQVIVAWFHHAGAEPTWRIPSSLGDGFTPAQCESYPLRTHVIEMAENSVDATHAVSVHGAVEPTGLLHNEVDGPRWQVRWRHRWPMKRALAQLNLMDRVSSMPEGFPDVLDLDYTINFYGLGYIHLAFELKFVKYEIHYRVCCTPIDDERSELRSITSVRPQPGAMEHIAPMVAGFIKEWTGREISPDFPIWETKIYRLRPALSDADGPFGKMRKWAAQFFPPGEQGPL